MQQSSTNVAATTAAAKAAHIDAKRYAHTDDSLFHTTVATAAGGATTKNDNATTTTSSTTDDIDANDNQSIECLVEYVNDTFRNLKQEEQQQSAALRPLSDAGQTELNGRVRAIAIDWLFDVRIKFHMRPETLFMAISLLDRYLSIGGAQEQVLRTDLQECACAAMMLASTLEESYPPETRDYVYISDNCFTAPALKTRSWRIAAALQFNLWSPNMLHFLRRYSKASKNDTKQHTLAKYYCQSALLNYHSLVVRYLPSQIAAASILLARLASLSGGNSEDTSTLNNASATTTATPTTTTTKTNNNDTAANATPRRNKPWSHTLSHYTGYSIKDIAECTATLWIWMNFLHERHLFRATYKEYSGPKLLYASKVALPTRETMLERLLSHLPADSVLAPIIVDQNADLLANANALFSFL